MLSSSTLIIILLCVCVCVYTYICVCVCVYQIMLYTFSVFKKKLDHRSESFREQPGQKAPLSRKEEMVWIPPHSLPPSSSSRHPICLPRPSPLTAPALGKSTVRMWRYAAWELDCSMRAGQAHFPHHFLPASSIGLNIHYMLPEWRERLSACQL